MHSEIDYGRNISSSSYDSSLSSIICSSQPYCIFRNHARYVYGGYLGGFSSSFRSKLLKRQPNYIKSIAKRQALSYCEVLGDQYIPHDLLQKTVELDISDNYSSSAFFDQEKRNSLVVFQGNSDDRYVIHCSGKNLDELTIRNSSFFLPQYCYPCQPAFSVNIGNGSYLRQITSSGRSNFGTKVNLLARTRYELFYLQAAEIDDFIDDNCERRKTSSSSLSSSSSLPFTWIIEPKEKFQFPEEILDLVGTSSDNHWNYGFALSKSMKLYCWNPIQGVKKHSENSIIKPLSINGYRPSNLELSLNPSIVYISHGSCLYSCDLRSNETSQLFNHMNLKNEENYDIKSIKQHKSNPHHYMLSYKNKVSFMDCRYSNEYMYQQIIPEAHDQLSHHQVSCQKNSSLKYLGFLSFFVCSIVFRLFFLCFFVRSSGLLSFL
jgi:hypothetical protein